jgi:hypothetical protein
LWFELVDHRENFLGISKRQFALDLLYLDLELVVPFLGDLSEFVGMRFDDDASSSHFGWVFRVIRTPSVIQPMELIDLVLQEFMLFSIHFDSPQWLLDLFVD